MQPFTVKEPELKLPEAMRRNLLKVEQREAQRKGKPRNSVENESQPQSAGTTNQPSNAEPATHSAAAHSDVAPSAAATPADVAAATAATAENSVAESAVSGEVSEGVMPNEADVPQTPTEPVAQPTSAEAAKPTPTTTPDGRELTPKEKDKFEDVDYWRKKYFTIEGLQRSTSKQLSEVKKQHEREIIALEQKIMDLEDKLEANRPPPEIDLTKYYTQDQIEEFGADVLKAPIKAAIETVQQEIRQQAQRNLPKRANGSTEMTPEQRIAEHQSRIFAAMDAKLPEWRQIDSDPVYHAWLAQPDPGTRLERQKILMAAYQSGDTEALAGMMQQFIDEHYAAEQPKTPTGAEKTVTSQAQPVAKAVTKAEPPMPPKGTSGTPHDGIPRQPNGEPALTKEYVSKMIKHISLTPNPSKQEQAEFDRFWQRLEKRQSA